jgi:hypothetical protein
MDSIHIKKKNKGKLHRALNVAPGKPIPAAKLQAADKSKNPSLREMAQFAINARKFKKR